MSVLMVGRGVCRGQSKGEECRKGKVYSEIPFRSALKQFKLCLP